MEAMATSPDPAEKPKGERVRDKLEAMARERPKAPTLRNIVWILVGGIVLVVGIAQATGIVESPVTKRVLEGRRGMASSGSDDDAASAVAPADEAPPMPAGLPSEYAEILRRSVDLARRPEVPLAGPALSKLPARAAEAPEVRRREVRAWALSAAVGPALVDRPEVRATALRALVEILDADPEAAAGPAKGIVHSGIITTLLASEADEPTLLAAVRLSATAKGTDRLAMAAALNAVVADRSKSLAARVAAAKALEKGEASATARAIASDPSTDAALRDAIDGK